MAFGGEIIDHRGVVRDFPGKAALTGLLANALGFDRSEGARHDRLQARLVSGALRLREGQALRDFQTANLSGGDRGWTTAGRYEGRAGGAATYASPHIRQRDWQADVLMLVALRLNPAEEAPRLEEVASALERPERPLFLGRKPALPSGPILLGTISAATVSEALRAGAGRLVRRRGDEPVVPCRAEWPTGEGEMPGARQISICDERRWETGVHGGLRQVMRGELPCKGVVS